MCSYHTPVVYKLMHQYRDVHNIPIHSISNFNNNHFLKDSLAQKQQLRCLYCHNPILHSDIHNYKLVYIKPLYYGGENNIYNLGLSCPSCYAFKPY